MNPIWFILVVLVAWILKERFLWRPTGTSHGDLKTPIFLGHRGAMHREPENTLPAYKSAVDAGMDGVEIDVMSTVDGEVVCSHNFDLERETDGWGYIDELTYADLGPVRTGVRKAALTPAGLNELLEVTDRLPKSVFLNIEIKSIRPFDLRTGRQVAKWIKSGAIKQRVIVSSFNPFVVAAVKWVDSTITTGLIMETSQWFKTINWVHPDALHPTAELVDENLVRYAKERGLMVNVWTVNTGPAIQSLLNRNVDGIISDYPELCVPLKA